MIDYVPTPAISQPRLADMTGSGTAGLVWSQLGPFGRDTRYFYLEFVGSTKPRLLTSIDNGIGLQTTIAYTTSAREAGRAAASDRAVDDHAAARPHHRRQREHHGHRDGAHPGDQVRIPRRALRRRAAGVCRVRPSRSARGGRRGDPDPVDDLVLPHGGRSERPAGPARRRHAPTPAGDPGADVPARALRGGRDSTGGASLRPARAHLGRHDRGRRDPDPQAALDCPEPARAASRAGRDRDHDQRRLGRPREHYRLDTDDRDPGRTRPHAGSQNALYIRHRPGGALSLADLPHAAERRHGSDRRRPDHRVRRGSRGDGRRPGPRHAPVRARADRRHGGRRLRRLRRRTSRRSATSSARTGLAGGSSRGPTSASTTRPVSGAP